MPSLATTATTAEKAIGERELRIKIRVEGVDPNIEREVIEALLGGQHPQAGCSRMAEVIKAARGHQVVPGRRGALASLRISRRLFEEILSGKGLTMEAA